MKYKVVFKDKIINPDEIAYYSKLEKVHHIEQVYDKNEDKDLMCMCGHIYYRHWDWMEDYRPGCKYCSCYIFKEPLNNENKYNTKDTNT